MLSRLKITTLVALALAFLLLVSSPAIANPPVPQNIVQVQASNNCYFGGTENLQQAREGDFGTVYVQKGKFYNWQLSHNGATLYYTTLTATGGPMPSHMPMKGSTGGGATLVCP